MFCIGVGRYLLVGMVLKKVRCRMFLKLIESVVFGVFGLVIEIIVVCVLVISVLVCNCEVK